MRLLEHPLGTIHIPGQHDDLDGLYDLMDADPEYWAADTETTGLDIYSATYRVRLVQVGTRDEAWLLRPDWPEHHQAIVDAVTRPGTWWHNFVFDALSLEQSEEISAEATMAEANDTEILSRLLDPRGPEHGGVGHHLKGLSAHYLKLPDVKDARAELLKAAKAKKYRDPEGKILTNSTLWAHIPVEDEDYELYAGQDVFLTARLAEALEPLVFARGLTKFRVFEQRLAVKCADMQRIGTAVDVAYAEEHRERFLEDYRVSEAALVSQWGITYTGQAACTAKKSLIQKFTDLGVTFTQFTEKTHEPQLTTGVMEEIASGKDEAAILARLVMQAKKSKHYADYLDQMIRLAGKDGRVHPDIRPMRAATARMSISNPPLQQIPKDDVALRGALVADEGEVLISADYAQVEFRVAAAISRDPVMCERILNGEDLHALVAENLYGPGFTHEQRDIAKRVGFGRLYRGLPKGLAAQTGIALPTVKKACKAFDKAYTATAKWGDKVQQRVKDGDPIVVTATGRPLICEKPWAAVNYSIQSPARDIFATGIMNLHKRGLGDRLRLVVHDEVILSVPEAEAEAYAHEIEEAMSMTFRGIPIITEAQILGKRWHK